MHKTQGIVISLDGEYAWVRMDEGGCGHCHEAGGCGGQRLEKIFCDKPAVFRVYNPGNAQPDERVTVAMQAGALSCSAMHAYGMPLLVLFVGAFGGLALAGEAGAMTGAGLGLLAGWFALRYSRSMDTDTTLQPYIKR